MSSPTSQGKMGKTCLPQKVWEDGEDREDMSSPTSQAKTGKTCLPRHLKEDREDMSSPTSRGR